MIKVQKSDMIIFKVIDNGIGISDEIRKNLGNFLDIKEITLEKTGFNLGIALAKRIVEVLHGEFFIKSAMNIGTEISFKLPL